MRTAVLGARAALLPLAASLALPLVLMSLPLLHLAPNRLVTGAPLPAATVFGFWFWPLLALSAIGPAVVVTHRRRMGALLGLLACAAGLALLLVGLNAGAAEHLAGQPPAARARLAAGAWLAGLGLSAGIFGGMRASRIPCTGWLSAFTILALVVALGAAGALDAVSLTVEFRARRDGLARAVLEHLALSGGALILAGFVTAALGTWRRGRGGIDLFVGGVQVVPAVALLGGLVAIASAGLALMPSSRAYGVSALGAGPALVGIACYLLLPLWRGLQGALRAPDPAALDAARALGLTPRQILTTLRLPLGAGLLIGGLRVAAVQALGLATLAPLVGAGGLGRLVFDGMAQFAPDLILLGALPVIALSLAAESALSTVEAAARRRWPS